jgi:predicted amidohydrolase YtcJ
VLIVAAELTGELVDVRCSGGVITEIAAQLPEKADEFVLEARGGALLPGLHDHHIHLFAQAAADVSLHCGPPQVADRSQLQQALQQSAGSGWLRGVGYHESVAGDLDRCALDQWQSERPLRIQHRSGKMWLLNTLATQLLELDDHPKQPGIERNAQGQVTGRLFRMDPWLRGKLAQQSAPELAPLSRRLASWGVTGVTDASASNSAAEMEQFCELVSRGEILQRVVLLGDLKLPPASCARVVRGALKILLDDHRLPEYPELVALIVRGHRQQRPVAIHCVTRTELVFALSALLEAGSFPGDRIEHASVTPDDALPMMLQAGVCVVTQPGFIFQRGDQYLVDVEPGDHDLLYRGKSFVDAGIPLAASSDAPYGSPDPWQAMRAAVDRGTRSGQKLGMAETLTPEHALALFTGAAEAPGSGPRQLAIGAVADLCLLDQSWQQARSRLLGADVLATLRDGELIYHRDRLATDRST